MTGFLVTFVIIALLCGLCLYVGIVWSRTELAAAKMAIVSQEIIIDTLTAELAAARAQLLDYAVANYTHDAAGEDTKAIDIDDDIPLA